MSERNGRRRGMEIGADAVSEHVVMHVLVNDI